jgi:hypothetical protein
MPREPIEETIEGARVTTRPLPGDKAEDLLPTMLEMFGTIAEGLGSGLSLTDDIGKLGPTLRTLGAYLGKGKLAAVASKLCAGTVVLADGEKYELAMDKDRHRMMEARADLYLPVLFAAWRVNFFRFFPAFGRTAKATPTPSA